MSVRTSLAAAALALVAVPFAGTSHAGCTSDLIGTRPPDPHSITATYIHAAQDFVACVS
ncbi:MAG TPA: hypothetical protein VGX28_08915 [Frankiaceae bacterium]|jgi:hypothetical protein|nr:hypothetical protein [Frankiaceae bacterium]